MTDSLVPSNEEGHLSAPFDEVMGGYGTVSTSTPTPQRKLPKWLLGKPFAPRPPVDLSSFSRKFGCEMLTGVFIVAIVIGALVGAGYVLSHWFMAGYTTNQLCVECLKLGFVYNESNTTCTTLSAANFTGFSTCPECVADSKYCGAPECRATQPFPPDWNFDVVLTPYWVILVSEVISICLSAVVNAFKIFIVRPIKKKYWVEYADDLDALEKEGGDFAFKRRLYIFINVFGAMNAYWYMVLYVFTMVHYGYIIYVVCDNHAGLTGWNKVLAMHLLWLNSGTVGVLGISPAQLVTWGTIQQYLDRLDTQTLGEEGKKRGSVLYRAMISIAMPLITVLDDEKTATFFHLLIFSLPLLVPTLLMVVPMLVVFLPMTLSAILVWVLILLFVERDSKVVSSLASLALRVLLSRIVGQFLIMILFQTAANYAFLYYSGMGWMDTIRTEYHLRNTKCYVNSLLNFAQLANIGFAGLLLS